MKQHLTELLYEKQHQLIATGEPFALESFVDYLIENGATIPVRCGECKHKNEWTKNGLGEYFCRRSGLWNLSDNCFCNCGEKASKQ